MFWDKKPALAEFPLGEREAYISTFHMAKSGIALGKFGAVPEKLVQFDRMLPTNVYPGVENEALKTGNRVLLLAEDYAKSYKMTGVRLRLAAPYVYGGYSIYDVDGSYGGKVGVELILESELYDKKDLAGVLPSMRASAGHVTPDRPVVDLGELVKTPGLTGSVARIEVNRFYKTGKKSDPRVEEVQLEYAFRDGRLAGAHMFVVDSENQVLKGGIPVRASIMDSIKGIEIPTRYEMRGSGRRDFNRNFDTAFGVYKQRDNERKPDENAALYLSIASRLLGFGKEIPKKTEERAPAPNILRAHAYGPTAGMIAEPPMLEEIAKILVPSAIELVRVERK